MKQTERPYICPVCKWAHTTKIRCKPITPPTEPEPSREETLRSSDGVAELEAALCKARDVMCSNKVTAHEHAEIHKAEIALSEALDSMRRRSATDQVERQSPAPKTL